jgi:DNA-binding NtrC family response regulator
VEEAHEGTLFLDEIGDLNPNMQTKLLRLLQEGEYKPVGSVVTRKADIRFVAATNHNLKSDINEKRFREDLYYRLNVIHVELPPLRERKKDIPLLSHHFLGKYAQMNHKDVQEISPEAIHLLMSKEYPGNVRELENIIERGVIFCTTDTLKVKDLQLDSEEPAFYPEVGAEMGKLSFKDAKDRMISRFHNLYIMSLLRESGGNISKAAEMAGIQRQYLHRLMKEAGIEAELFRDKNGT